MRRLDDAKGKRANGAGTVREKAIPGRPTRYQALGPRGQNGKRPSLGCFATFEEADRVREAAVRTLAQESPMRVTSTTLRVFGETYLDEREHDAPRSVRTERARWKHVLTAPFIDDPIDEIDTPELQAWLRVVGRSIPGVVNGIKALLSGIYGTAVRARKVKANPVAEVQLVRQARTHEPWTYLPPEEQMRLLSAPIPEHEQLMIAFAMLTGMREGEQFALRLTDVHLDRGQVTVRFGSPFGPTKGKKIRVCHLSPQAQAVLRRWLELLPGFCPENPHKLVFPGPAGGFRQPGVCLRGPGPRNGWLDALKAAGLQAERRHDGRPVRWHDLRHTCASSLIAGWWGHAWRMEEVKEQLGHATLAQTQRYAHLAPGVIGERAGVTTGLAGWNPAVGSALVPVRPAPAAPQISQGSRNTARALAALGPEPACTTRMSSFQSNDGNDRGTRTSEPTENPRGDLLAQVRGALEAVATQDPHAMTRVVEALSAVLVVLVEERAEDTARSA